jgi:flagellar basal-body rod protein FlgB
MADSTNVLGGIQQAMRHLSERQKVIAGNLANSDTPGFRALDVKAPDFAALVDQSAKQVNRPVVAPTAKMLELGGSAINAPGSSDVIQDKSAVEVRPDGNNVNLEEQMLKMSQVQSDYVALISLYRKHLSLFKTAVGK